MIKFALLAFTDLNYEVMEIANGSEAMNAYLNFIQGKLAEYREEKVRMKIKSKKPQEAANTGLVKG